MAQTDYAGFAVPTQLVGTLPSGAGAGTVVQLLNGTGYPTGALGINFVLTFDKNTGTEEKILCSLRSGNNITIAQRGYDDTSPAVHTNSVVAHTVDATILRTASAHIFDVTRDDHTQYARADGTRAVTGVQAFANGGITIGDTNLFRASAGVLKTDSVLVGGNGVQSGADPIGVAGFTTLSNMFGIGNGANTNLQAPAVGTGDGPLSLTAVQFVKIRLGTAVHWIAAFQ